ncbi:uncharacterized protein LOC110226602 isoform X2 [Arabidopsis lyrata subsp. lyrata]|uniref:uncharacterized protein LOC110226602 isoform X2 n=1 Tax=Arabidopsis lyrata subsp. lyrata TaxID=81972 RepID=UPI000A29CED0|nr:uncharacterized protein LOC110226602 isoform X2 [Arabidopsis lyrata subsp. lyrata]|eukprot:XP_020874286.1 uncharacterized protein LOC110226602 isoform X2 [Arabidopsis lyrata subsp. lyrata]
MDTRKIPLFCFWNGCIKDGPDGPFYEGSSPRGIRVDSKIELSRLLDDLHLLTGFEKGKFQIDLIGRYPSIVQQQMVKYVRLPIVDDCSLEMMLEVPSYHPSISNLEFYLEIKPFSDEVTVPISHQSPLENNATRKRYRQEDASSVNADVNVSVRNTKLRSPPEDNHNGWIEDEESTDIGNCGDNGVAQKDSKMKNPTPTKGVSDSVSKQLIFSSPWLDESELHVGMIFRGEDELDKAVNLYSNRRQREYNEYKILNKFVCKRNCGWALKATKMNGNGFKITEYTGPHTCKPAEVGSDFLAGEIEGIIKAQPSVSIVELNAWVKEEFGYTVSRTNMWHAKKKAITGILGDLDKSFSVLPKFMAALSSSNKMLLEWQYDPFPDPKDASFRSVFWAFQQSIEGFPHCRPVIIVDTVDLSSKYPGKLLVAAGFDAENRLFPLAFVITTQESLSADTWRWFFSCIRKKVTRREGLCLITSPNPGVVAVVKEPECQWAQHRFCLRHMCLKFYDVFHNNLMTEFVYKAGSTRYVSTFVYYLKKIEKMNPKARKWLDKIPPHQWALAYDDGGLRVGILTTNTIFRTYGFLNTALDLPITTCILLIFDYLAEAFKTLRGLSEESLTGRDLYSKYIMNFFEECKEASRTHDVLPLDQTGEKFQVTEVMQVRKTSFVVHLNDQYVDDCYSTESYLAVYAADFKPLPGVSDWPEASEVPRLFPPGSRPISTQPSKATGGKKRSNTGKKKVRSEMLNRTELNVEDGSGC